jgi:PAS domain S-box-containing protein
MKGGRLERPEQNPKDIQAQLQQRHFQADIISHMRDAVVGVDNNHKVVFFNNSAERLYGKPQRQAVGRHCNDLFKTEWPQPADAVEALNSLASTGSWTGENIHLLSSGEIIFVESSVSLLKDRDGNNIGFLNVIRDIRDRKKAYWENSQLLSQLIKQRKDNEANFRMLVEAAPDGIVTLTDSGWIADCNDWMCWMTAYPKEKIVGEKFIYFVEPGDCTRVEKNMKKVSSQKNVETEFNLLKSDGSRVHAWSKMMSLQMADGAPYTVLYIRDITEKKHLDYLKDDFIALVSHEMRTPLTVIIGGLITISQDGDRLKDEERKQLIDDAIAESEELSHILDNLLELSRSQAERLKLTRTTVSIADIINKVVTRFRKKSSHRFETDLPPDLPLIEADPLRIERVIYNLLQNAVKYSPTDKDIKLLAARQTSAILVGVSDHGEGIADGDMESLFNPFQRARQAKENCTKGVGLGLVVCRRLVEAHGGRIWLESKQGQGTTCYFTLPFTLARGEASRSG